jgi:hypothetical protein
MVFGQYAPDCVGMHHEPKEIFMHCVLINNENISCQYCLSFKLTVLQWLFGAVAR